MLENESFLQLMKVISDIKESDLSVSGFDYEEYKRCLIYFESSIKTINTKPDQDATTE